jgi:hypothetical protein
MALFGPLGEPSEMPHPEDLAGIPETRRPGFDEPYPEDHGSDGTGRLWAVPEKVALIMQIEPDPTNNFSTAKLIIVSGGGGIEIGSGTSDVSHRNPGQWRVAISR